MRGGPCAPGASILDLLSMPSPHIVGHVVSSNELLYCPSFSEAQLTKEFVELQVRWFQQWGFY